MLMVIFGAGASYDSAPAHPINDDAFDGLVWRPPLANNLFSNPQHAFSHIVKEYPKLTHVLPYLRERPEGKSVEEVLEDLQGESKEYPERVRELASIQYYLRDLLFEVTNKWLAETDGVTNYAPLIGEILRLNRNKEPVALVTFNYDLLLDNALFSFDYKPRAPEDQFDSHPTLKLFKPHGSVDWARTVRLPSDARLNRRGLIENADSIKLTSEFVRADSPLYADGNPGGKTLFPVVAIPLQNKSDETFACPPDHLAYLKELIPSVTKILIIGWQAKEAHFLRMLQAGLPRQHARGVTRVAVVGRNSDDGKATLHYFAGALGLYPYSRSYTHDYGGFTRFVANSEIEEFLLA